MNKIWNILNSKSGYKTFNIVGTGFFFFILFLKLVLPHAIGMADNGDYFRTMERIGLSHISSNRGDIYFNYLVLHYSYHKHYAIPYTLSQVIGYFSLLFNNIFATNGVYNILYMGFINIILYTSVFYLFIAHVINRMQLQLFLKAFLVLLFSVILTDGMFTFYFNSFYQESISLITIFLFVSYLLTKDISPTILLWMLFFIIISKIQNIAFFFLFPVIIFLYKKQLKKNIIIFFIILFTFLIFYTAIDSTRFKIPNTYNSFFYGLVKNLDAKTSSLILQSAGLNYDNYKKYIGKGYWPAGVQLNKEEPSLYKKFYKNVTQFKIIKLYLFYPKTLINNLVLGLKELSSHSAKINYIGNLTKVESVKNSRTFLDTLLGNTLNNIFPYIYIFSLIISVFSLKKGIENISSTERAILLLTFVVPFIFVINIAGDGFYEFVKHSLSLYFVIILLLICNILYAINKITVAIPSSSQYGFS